jgi:hypothetical protein
MAEAPPRGALPAAFSRPPWRAVAVLAVCAALTMLAVSAGVTAQVPIEGAV